MGLREKILDRSAKVGVLGLGYVGLPLAVEFAKAGFRVFGIDVDADRVSRILAGNSYIQDVPAKVLGELGLHTERVSEPSEVIPALKRALAVNESGQPSYIEFICSQYPVYGQWVSR